MEKLLSIHFYMFKKRKKRNFYNVSPSYKNAYLKQNPNINKIIEETKNILNNEKPIKQEYKKPKTQNEWTNFHKMNENGIKQAYAKPEGYHIENNKLYIAGTRDFKDVMDWYKIPMGTF